MKLTAQKIRELADMKYAQAVKSGSPSEELRVRYQKREWEKFAQNLDDFQELLGVSYLSVEIGEKEE